MTGGLLALFPFADLTTTGFGGLFACDGGGASSVSSSPSETANGFGAGSRRE
ncbi:hypothetical protein DIPPA_09896 [Diplonema papillatum]|nr:hypothetical protein DIPPA_09896 [Diplonema papillatum]